MIVKLANPFFTYKEKYDSNSIHGIEKSRPWNLMKIIIKRTSKDGKLVDVGCGPAKKIIPLDSYIDHIVGIDINKRVLQNAKKNIKQAHTKHIKLMEGDVYHLPFFSASIDVLTYMLTSDDPNEAYRVLKQGGYVIIERIGEHDKENIKKYFGKDKKGKPRGYRSELAPGTVAQTYKTLYRKIGFKEIEVRNGFWKTWYTKVGFQKLLEETPTIKDYDKKKDLPIVKKIIKELNSPQGIETIQHRVLIIAKK